MMEVKRGEKETKENQAEKENAKEKDVSLWQPPCLFAKFICFLARDIRPKKAAAARCLKVSIRTK